MVVLGHGAFSFENLDSHTVLVVLVSGKDLRFLGGDKGSTVNQRGHDSANSLNTQSQRGDIKKDNFLSGLILGKNTSLDSGTISDSFIGVNTTVRFLSVEEIFQELLDLGDTSGSSDQNNFVNLTLRQLGVLQSLLNRLQSLLKEIHVEFLELGTRQSQRQVFTLAEALDFDLSLMLLRQSSLGTLRFTSKFLDGFLVLGTIHTSLLLELLQKVLHDSLIKIFASKMSITSSRKDFKDTRVNGQNRNIKSTTTKIVNHDVLFLVFLIKSISNRSSGRLVDDSKNVQTGNGTSVLGGLTLSIIEIGRDSDDSSRDLLSKIRLSDFFHLSQNHRRDFLGGENLVVSLDLNSHVGFSVLVEDLEWKKFHVRLNSVIGIITTNQTLDIKESVLGIQSSLVLGSFSDQTFSIRKGNVRGGDTVSKIIGDNFDTSFLENTDTREGGSQINTNHSSIFTFRFSFFFIFLTEDKAS
mmetsp:Transcript_33377/g.45689  ORF Transcript_33377/g.45689 Transcript_33377/m.45689 type:complete len:468 (-) Transcript_33377:106-1509(-)